MRVTPLRLSSCFFVETNRQCRPNCNGSPLPIPAYGRACPPFSKCTNWFRAFLKRNPDSDIGSEDELEFFQPRAGLYPQVGLRVCAALFLLFVFLGMAELSLGQENQKEERFLTWSDFNYSSTTSPNWTLGGDAGVRGLLTSDEFTTIYLRPMVAYKVNKDISLAAAIAGFQTFRAEGFDLFEFRLAQEIHATWPRLDRLYFTHRLRNEERFYFENQNEELPKDDSNFENRLRYRLGVETKDFHITSKIKNLKLLGGVEYFQTFQSRTDSERFNDSRVSVGYSQSLRKGRSYSLIFIWQRSRDVFDNDFSTDQFIMRLRVYLKQVNH